MNQKYKGHRILISLCLLASFLVLLAGCAQKDAPGAPQTLCGTYTSGGGDAQVILSVDGENRFYYADQKNDLFIQGSIQDQGEGAYLISCEDPEKAAIIPEQEFTVDGESLSLTIGEYRYEFQKADDVPSIIGDISHYS